MLFRLLQMRASPHKAGLSGNITFWKYRNRILYWDYLHDDFRGFIMNHQTKYFLEYIGMLPEGSVTILYELHIDPPHDTTSQNKERRLTMCAKCHDKPLSIFDP